MSTTLKKFLIERNVDLSGKSREELAAATQDSCSALREVGTDKVQWRESFVCKDKIYCVYMATDAEAVRAHAAKAGIPADRVEEVAVVLDPTFSG
ncbi:hypothetical protein C2E21_4970 [Chlorella sorokiniana]|uniref:DUF4242 domain-containing protein n=1 Tax=Chlorella sorokiniana TaxID=3076 RepID=A0A2P6TPW0_CHLSO|nr:hypothetical protein C2E21_4970 [Chlorella sorokiniana]|eukprot:PRW56073.1 hypothetical protein C2E21_4970 [Chlorella sorokiniana]